jgi:hypothetical protein
VTVLQVTLQRLLVVAAALALLGHGGLDIAPRLVAAATSSTAGAAGPATARPVSRPAAESKPVAPASTLRTALAVPAPPSGGDTAAGPGSTLTVAPHLVAQPVVRPPTPSYVLGAGGGASGRAPPAPAGT